MSSVSRSYGGDVLRLDPDLDLWDQHPGESDVNFAAFRAYLRLPRPRKLPGLVSAGEVSWSVGHLRRVADQMLWHSRGVAFDEFRDQELDGRIADERIVALHRRLDFLREMTGLTLDAMRAKDPSELRPRDLVELLKVLLVAEDNVLGLPQRSGGGYSGASVGVELSVPLNQSSQVIEGQIEDLMAEINSRGGGESGSG